VNSYAGSSRQFLPQARCEPPSCPSFALRSGLK
jgi:hypothetical protein